MNQAHYQIVILSDADESNLSRKIDRLLVRTNSEAELRELLEIESRFAPEDSFKIGFVVKPADSVKERLDNAKDALNNKRLTAGYYFNNGQTEYENICLIFPGLGVQYIGMALQLKERFTPAKRVFTRADNFALNKFGFKLSDIIAGSITVDGLTGEDALTLSKFSNPAILAVSFATLDTLKITGFRHNCVIGASLGGYASMVSAGSFCLEEAFDCSYEFGRIALETTEPSQMAAVLADVDTVQSLLDEVDDYVKIVNINGPKQQVIAGSVNGVDEALRLFKQNYIHAVMLPISVGYHCDLVDECHQGILPYLQGATWRKPLLRVHSTVGEAGICPENNIKDYAPHSLANMLIETVQFDRQVQNVAQLGKTIYVDPGPGGVMAGIVQHTGYDAVGLLTKGEDEVLHFLESVVDLSMKIPGLNVLKLNDI